jgi:hypothetical protein
MVEFSSKGSDESGISSVTLAPKNMGGNAVYIIFVYGFCLLSYPSIVNLWLLKSQMNKILAFTLSLNTMLCISLLLLRSYFDMVENIGNIILVIIISLVFIVSWIIRKNFPPKVVWTFDLEEEKDKNVRLAHWGNKLKKYFSRIKFVLLLIILLLILSCILLRFFEIPYISVKEPIVYIWNGMIALSMLVTFRFNIKWIKTEIEKQ